MKCKSVELQMSISLSILQTRSKWITMYPHEKSKQKQLLILHIPFPKLFVPLLFLQLAPLMIMAKINHYVTFRYQVTEYEKAEYIILLESKYLFQVSLPYSIDYKPALNINYTIYTQKKMKATLHYKLHLQNP